MVLGRFLPIVLVLALAGSLAQQQPVPETEGTLPTHRPLFVGLVVGVALIVTGLTYFPALALGPLAEGLFMTVAQSPHPSHACGRGLVRPRPAAALTARRRSASSTRQHGAATRSCSWCTSARSSPPCVASPSPASSPGWSPDGCGSPWSSPTWPRLSPKVAGKAQAATLRQARTDTMARRILPDGDEQPVSATELLLGDRVVVAAGEVIPGDGDVVEGVASVDESAITGESAPVIRESGGDRSAVTGGTKVLSDRIVVQITSKPGETFIDRMIALVEGAVQAEDAQRDRAQHPARQPDDHLLAGRGRPCSRWRSTPARQQTIIVLVALLVCLIPTTIGALLSAIGIAGMDRLVQRNVLAMSGRAVEAAGDVNTLLLDKTGTITLGNRQAAELIAMHRGRRGNTRRRGAAVQPRRRDPGGSVRSSCSPRQQYGLRERGEGELGHAAFVPFTAQTRMSGVDLSMAVRQIRKGAAAAVISWVRDTRVALPAEVGASRRRHLRLWRYAAGGRRVGRPQARVLGVIHLKDVVKEGMRERFDELRRMGIRTVMITGDNPLTARAIAEEAGVDDFLAEATPEDKMALIRKEQEGGRLVAMTGDGTNDAPALAQADVGVAMNTGTSAAKEAGNMVDLDSNPTKLIEIVEIGKQLLITRGVADHLLDRQRRREVLRDHPGDVRRRLSGTRRAQHHAPVDARSRRSSRR